jgi:hypothetical protein
MWYIHMQPPQGGGGDEMKGVGGIVTVVWVPVSQHLQSIDVIARCWVVPRKQDNPNNILFVSEAIIITLM